MLVNRFVLVTLCFALLFSLNPHSFFASGFQESGQPAISWKTFTDRNNLSTVQYPSNWTPVGVAEESGPIDILFKAPVAEEDKVAEVEFIQYTGSSPFRTPQESLESEINGLKNDPEVTKFEIERPLECQTYKLSGFQACSYIYEVVTSDGSQLAIMAVDALTTEGTEYEVYYKASFDIFEYFLPVAENMIRSFQVTGASSEGTDFSLGGGGSGLNDTSTTTNTTGTNTTGTNMSNADDFSLTG